MVHVVSLTKISQMVSTGILLLSLIACGSDGSDPASPLRTGVFLDSAPVEGLSYVTRTMSGKTNADGEFTFNAGEQITFSLGGLTLPEVQAASAVTALTLFADDEASAADLSRLLQSMDKDGSTDEVIRLPLQVESVTSDTRIDFGGADFDMQAQALLAQVNGPQAILIDGATATANFNQSLIDNQLVAENCAAEHPFVGRSADLSNLAHGVGGTVTVISDCEIEVTNFNYDGGGPDVFFLAAIDRGYSVDSFKIGPRLDGKQWVNDTIRLSIPDDKTLDDFDSLSVWCFRIGINFGDAFFGDL